MIDLPLPSALPGLDEVLHLADVVLYRLQGDRERGQLLAFDRRRAAVSVRIRAGELITVLFADLRYLHFVKPLPLPPAAGELQPLQPCHIDFRDGKRVQFMVRHAVHETCGWHVFQENDGQLRRLFVPEQAIAQHTLDSAIAAIALGPPTPLHGAVANQAELYARLERLAHPSSADGRRPVVAGGRIGEILERSGAVTDEELHRALAEKFGLLFVQLKDFDLDPAAVALLPGELARKYRVLPLALHDSQLIAAMENPVDNEALQLLAFKANRRLQIVVAARRDIEEAIERCYGAIDQAAALEDMDRSVLDSVEMDDDNHADLEKIGRDKPIVRLVNNIMLDAIRRGASDIHIRPDDDDVQLLFRVDGALLAVRRFSKTLLRPLVSRIKIIGSMDIAIRRLPQDGQARVQDGNNQVDLRISVMPTVNGESVVIRLLNAQTGLKNINEIGLAEADRVRFVDMLHKSSGLILVTGPTGSGKSTTLYSAVQALIEQNLSIITVEDPVEYHIRGVEQIQVHSAAGLSFARALRNILRHDPDAIMVGEIRDRETAQIALESALTGHLVLSTLHTSSAAVTVTRLLEMGIDPFLLNSTLLGVLAQRLLRRNCPHCLAEDTAKPFLRQVLGVAADERFYRGQGCGECSGLGYRGRLVTYELMPCTAALRRLIDSAADSERLHAQAVQDGMTPLTQHALSLARQRLTSLEEVYRVRLE